MRLGCEGNDVATRRGRGSIVENQMIAPSLVLLACSLLWGDDLPILSATFTDKEIIQSKP